MKYTGWTIVSIFLFVGCSGDGSSPTEPPPPELPRGVASATALDNLGLIAGLEAAERPGTVLVSIDAAGVDLEGRVGEGGGWDFQFADRDDRRYTWTVWSDGRITFFGPDPPIIARSFLDIGPLIRLDSDELVALSMGHGAQRFADAFEEVRVRIVYYHIANILTASLQFSSPEAVGFCEPQIWLDGETGTLLGKSSFDCVDRED